MGENTARFAKACPLKHGRPKQCVKIDNVFANKVIKLGLCVFTPVLVKIQAFFFTELLKACHIADRRIEPNIEILARCTRNFKTKVGRITRDIPFAQITIQPFSELVGHFLLDMALLNPIAQHVSKVLQLKEMMLGRFSDRYGTANR